MFLNILTQKRVIVSFGYEKLPVRDQYNKYKTY